MINGAYIPSLKRLYDMASATFTITVRVVHSGHESHDDLAKHLQFLDILNQRIDHLVQAHDRVMQLYVDDLFKESFLHLQYFQFEVVAYELLESLSEIKQYIRKNLADEGLNAFFSTSPTIKDQIDITKIIISKEAGPAKFIGLPPLTTRQVSVCSQLYTMASERIVLEWFLEARIPRTTVDLLAYFRKRIEQEDASDTELF